MNGGVIIPDKDTARALNDLARHKVIGFNGFGDKKTQYRVQVICNRCRSRGKPIITDGLVNPNPYISKWGNCGDGTSPNGSKQTSMFAPYVVKAIEAWNHREEEVDV